MWKDHATKIKRTDYHGGQGGLHHHEGVVEFKRRVGLNAAKNDGGTTPTTVVLEPHDQKRRWYDAWPEKIFSMGADVRVQC